MSPFISGILLGVFVGANIGIVVAGMFRKDNCKCILNLKEHEKKFIDWWRNHPNYRPIHITGPDWINGSKGGRTYSDRPNMQEIKKRR